MPAGGGMDFTYGQQNEVTGGPDAGEKSRPRARETAATYKNQFMSENLSKKVVGISRIANFQQLKDTSDLKELSIQDGLFLKPIAQLNVSVAIPAIINKRNQKAISNWEVMERLKAMVAPREFTTIKVTKSTLDFIRFEGEVANKPVMEDIISRIDAKHMKLSGFSEPFKIKCGPAKSNYPTKSDWNNFFRDATDMDETKPGERPDTVHLQNLPCKFFNIGDNIRPSEGILKRVFGKYGEIRQMDIPVLDPYRPKIDPTIDARKHSNPVLFDVYIQYKSYDGFMLCMDGLRDMKLVLNKEQVLATNIIVQFDKSRHLSERELKKRYLLRRRILKEEDTMADEKKRRIEQEEQRIEEEKLKEEERQKIKEERRRRREEKRRQKKLERAREKEQKRMNQRIDLEERKLLLTQRRLEAVRMLTYLFEKLKTEEEYEEVKMLEKEIERRRKAEAAKQAQEEEKKQAALQAAMEEKQKQLGQKEETLKEKLLRRKLERQAEEAKKDIKLEDFSDEEYDTHKRFQEKQIKHTTTMQRPMGRRSRTPEAKRGRGVTPSPPRRKKKQTDVKKEEPRTPSPVKQERRRYRSDSRDDDRRRRYDSPSPEPRKEKRRTRDSREREIDNRKSKKARKPKTRDDSSSSSDGEAAQKTKKKNRSRRKSTSSSSSSSSSDSDGEVKRSRKKKSKRESPPPRKSKRSPKRSRSRERRRSRDRRR